MLLCHWPPLRWVRPLPFPAIPAIPIFILNMEDTEAINYSSHKRETSLKQLEIDLAGVHTKAHDAASPEVEGGREKGVQDGAAPTAPKHTAR